MCVANSGWQYLGKPLRNNALARGARSTAPIASMTLLARLRQKRPEPGEQLQCKPSPNTPQHDHSAVALARRLRIDSTLRATYLHTCCSLTVECVSAVCAVVVRPVGVCVWLASCGCAVRVLALLACRLASVCARAGAGVRGAGVLAGVCCFRACWLACVRAGCRVLAGAVARFGADALADCWRVSLRALQRLCVRCACCPGLAQAWLCFVRARSARATRNPVQRQHCRQHEQQQRRQCVSY